MTQYIIPQGVLVQPVRHNGGILPDTNVTLNRIVVLDEVNCSFYFGAKTNESIFGYYSFHSIIDQYKGFWYFVADVTAEKL